MTYSADDEMIPTTPPDVVAGMLAVTLDEAMQRLHNTHRARHYDDSDWKRCVASTLCAEAAAQYESPEVQLAIAAAAAGQSA